MEEVTAELQVLQAINHFALDLYNILAKAEGNVFFSPISVHTVLAMTYPGAQGTTAQSFSKTLHLPNVRVACDGYNEIMKRLNSVSDVALLMANKAYIEEKANLLADFQDAVTKNFLSEVEHMNFRKTVEAAKMINDWVEKQTQNKIKDLILAADLNTKTRLILINAIYFKGNWKHKFNKDYTSPEPFYLDNIENSVDVLTMSTKNKFFNKYDKDLRAHILQLLYINEDLSLIIILPYDIDGIKDVESKLTPEVLVNAFQGMSETELCIRIPKFKVEQTIDLEQPLSALGLVEIFDDCRANLKGVMEMKCNEILYVDKVIQKAFIEVNEEGAEAAAATAKKAIIKKKGPREFIANHPFIYVIAERKTIPLFMGRLSRP